LELRELREFEGELDLIETAFFVVENDDIRVQNGIFDLFGRFLRQQFRTAVGFFVIRLAVAYRAFYNMRVYIVYIIVSKLFVECASNVSFFI